jgi:hypothetical protein
MAAGTVLMSLAKGVGNALANLCKTLSGGEPTGDGRSNPVGIDPSELMGFLNKSTEVEDSFNGPDQKVEKAISGLIKDTMVECVKASALAPPPLTAAVLLASVGKNLPKLMEGRDFGGLTSDYLLKNPKFLTPKIDDVLEKFNVKGTPFALRAFASQVGSEMQSHLGQAVPKTPAQKNGLDHTDAISENLDQTYAPKQEIEQNRNVQQAPTGPSI